MRTAAGPVIRAGRGGVLRGHAGSPAGRARRAAAPIPLVPWEEPAPRPRAWWSKRPRPAPGLTRIVHAPEVYLRPHAGGLVHLEAPDAAVDLHTPDRELRGAGRVSCWAGPAG